MIAGMPAQRYGRKKVLMVIALMYLLSAIGLFTHIHVDIFYHFPDYRWHRGRCFFRSRTDVYFRNFTCRGAGAIDRNVPAEYCHRNFGRFSHQFFICAASERIPGDGCWVLWWFRQDCSLFCFVVFRKAPAG